MRLCTQVRRPFAIGLIVWLASFLAAGYCLGEPVSAKQASYVSWVPTGNLNIGRTGHTATLLPNGRVLVVGGSGEANILDSAELYDPATGKWSVTGNLSRPRAGHTATLLGDGRVLVAGGATSTGLPFAYTESAEVYDPATGVWTLTGGMSTNRGDHTATLLTNGKVLVAGGYGSDTLGSAELYDPVVGTWTPTGNLKVARYGHTATLLHDATVLAAGGSDDGDLASTLNAAESYDSASGTWSLAPSLLASVIAHTSTLLGNGEILVAGGYLPRFVPGTGTVRGALVAAPVSLAIAQLYDPATMAWTYTGSLSAGREAHTATLLPDGRVVVAGGGTWQGKYPDLQHHALDSVETYDPASGGWATASSLNTARSGHTATLLADGRVLVAGGDNDELRSLATAELYGDVVVPGTVGPGYTGNWYDPTQSGHGLFVEVLANNAILAWWFTFSPAGDQSWFGGVGNYSGNTATISQTLQTIGGKWIPNFDPTKTTNVAWGTLTLTFTDCNHGRVDFTSNVPGYGTGFMNLTRLTLPTGLTCP